MRKELLQAGWLSTVNSTEKAAVLSCWQVPLTAAGIWTLSPGQRDLYMGHSVPTALWGAQATENGE